MVSGGPWLNSQKSMSTAFAEEAELMHGRVSMLAVFKAQKHMAML